MESAEVGTSDDDGETVSDARWTLRRGLPALLPQLITLRRHPDAFERVRERGCRARGGEAGWRGAGHLDTLGRRYGLLDGAMKADDTVLAHRRTGKRCCRAILSPSPLRSRSGLVRDDNGSGWLVPVCYTTRVAVCAMSTGRAAFLKLPTGAPPARSRTPSPVRPERRGRLRKGTRLAVRSSGEIEERDVDG